MQLQMARHNVENKCLSGSTEGLGVENKCRCGTARKHLDSAEAMGADPLIGNISVTMPAICSMTGPFNCYSHLPLLRFHQSPF